MTICVAEDRKSHETSVKLLLLSVHKYCPTVPVELFCPVADEGFIRWLERCPNVTLNSGPLPGKGWNVKPHAIMATMLKGHDDVTWIDSDIILAADYRPAVDCFDRDMIVVTEEALWGAHEDPDAMRARSWGFDVGRVLPFCLNTAILRVTRSHQPLLERWRTLLEGEAYTSAQRLEWNARPWHMFGDQDVLTALLASRDFSDIPLRFLLRGKDIIQYFGPYGYTCAERIRNLVHGMPPFIHPQVNKPWGPREVVRTSGTALERLERLYRELSPYKLAAREYRFALEEDCSWMAPGSGLASLIEACGLWRPPLVGLPLAVMVDGWRGAKQVKRFFASVRGSK